MQIIVVPEGIRKGVPACLSHRHLTLIVLVGLVLLPAVVGVLAYKLTDYYERQYGGPALNAYRKELLQSRTALRKSRDEAARHLNALALKMGSLQAQVLRLNALGSRLTRMAGLDGREFSFDTVPGVGGPEKSAAAAATASPDITRNMEVLARDLDRSQARLMALESMMMDRRLVEAVTPAGWPVQGGWVSSGFGTRMDPFTGHQSIHEGVDIAARFGGPIFAMGDGVVNFAGEKTGYGLIVEVTHESGLVTRYSHCSATLVKEGDKVARGQEVARVGTTGRSTGPHLHFEVIRDGRATNPIAYLDADANLLTKKAVVASKN
jgi:murein DD-endopeptidase MepM/ murein hydrolase activator NlpD